MPDNWEDAHGLNKSNAQDAVADNATNPGYLNIEVYINTLTDTPPATFIRPPSDVTLSASTIELPSPYSKIVIQWADNASNEDHFVLQRSTDGVTYTDIAHPAANATSFIDSTGLAPNSTYYYRLQAVNATGFSSYSAPVSVKTPPLPSLSAGEVLGLFHTSPLPLQPYSPSPAARGALEGYGDTVRITWKGGSKTAATNSDQAMGRIDAPEKFIVYPTPASNQCTIAFNLSKPGKYKLEIYNSQGRLVQVVSKGETSGNHLLNYPMNTSQLSTGVYFIKLVTANGVKVKQLVIQR